MSLAQSRGNSWYWFSLQQGTWTWLILWLKFALGSYTLSVDAVVLIFNSSIMCMTAWAPHGWNGPFSNRLSLASFHRSGCCVVFFFTFFIISLHLVVRVTWACRWVFALSSSIGDVDSLHFQWKSIVCPLSFSSGMVVGVVINYVLCRAEKTAFLLIVKKC